MADRTPIEPWRRNVVLAGSGLGVLANTISLAEHGLRALPLIGLVALAVVFLVFLLRFEPAQPRGRPPRS